VKRGWFLTAAAAFAGFGMWAACTAYDANLTSPTDAGLPDAAGPTTDSGTGDAQRVFTITASPANVGLVRQGDSFEIRFERAGGRGKVDVKATLAPASDAIDVPGDFTHLEGQGPQSLIVAVGGSAAQREYELAFFANDDSTPVAQASSKVQFRVIGQPGAIDQSFGGADAGTGVLLVPNAPLSSLVILPNGKIVAAGGTAAEFVVVRLETDGTLDSTFGAGGIVRDTVNAGAGIAAIALDGNDIIAAGGVNEILVRRYSAAGAPSTIIDVPASGVEVHDMVLSPDGKIVLAGGVPANENHFAAKFSLANGAPDTGFGSGGIVQTRVSAASSADRAVTVAAMADGRVVTGGRTFTVEDADGRLTVLRYNPDGGLDPTFASGGAYIYQFGQGYEDEVRSITVTPTGELHFVSDQFKNAEGRVLTVSRLLPNGTRDETWWPAPNPLGHSLYAARDGGVIPRRGTELDGGAWLIAGTNGAASQALVTRVSSTAALDPTFGTGGFSVFAAGPGSQALRAAVDSKGYVVAVGLTASSGFVVRLFP
jgi:uncharacterized delta-60 repeat protein